MKLKTGITLTALYLIGMSLPTAAEPITVSWRNKPPYHYSENGVEKGFLLERAKKIFAAAGVPAHFIEEPAKRIWMNFASGATSYCSIGWYRLPERELLAQFSVPFHTDPSHTLLFAAAAVGQVRAHRSLASLLKDKELTLGVVDGVSYGPELDAMILHAANHLERKTVDPATMMRMLAANRVSFMFIDRNDWNYLRKREENLKNVVQQDFPDMPPGLKRHIVCSKDVAADIMAKLNRAIESR